MKAELKTDNAIHGDHLEAEIERAIGVPVMVTFYPPRTVDVLRRLSRLQGEPLPKELEEGAAAAVAAHVPQEPAQQGIRRAIIQTARGAEGKMLNALTAAEVRSLMALLLWRAGGVTDAGGVKALEEWL